MHFSVIFLTFLCSIVRLEKVSDSVNYEIDNEKNHKENPFKLFENEEIDEEKDPFRLFDKEIIDEINPFVLFDKTKINPPISEEEFKADILLHRHLVKILWNKIGVAVDKKVESEEIILKVLLTRKMVDDINIYINSSNSSFSFAVNEHFLNNLKKEEKKEEIVFDYEKKTSLFENTYFKLFSIITTALCAVKWPRIVIMVFIGYCVWHLDFSKQKDAELKQQFMVTKPIPNHCKDNDSSRWNSIKRWFHGYNEEDCFQHYKIINTETNVGDNPMKIMAELTSDTFVTLLKPFGDLIGAIYVGLNKHMYFPMALIILTLIFLFATIFLVGIFKVYWMSPTRQPLPPLEEENLHRRHTPRHVLYNNVRKRRPRMIGYR